VFTFELLFPHCVACGRRGLRLRAEGELKQLPVVFVVEDEEPLQEIVHDALKEGGFDLTMVASGQEAVAMIESGVVKYSALVTDVNSRDR
jgi:CheY-like chemotaxis protein